MMSTDTAIWELAARITLQLAKNLPETFSLMDMDMSFYDNLERLELSEAKVDYLFGLWLRLTDHEKNLKLKALTRTERQQLVDVMRRMLAH